MNRQRVAWLFLAPALIVLGLFFLLPVIAALALSLTDYDIYALANIHNLRFVALNNYWLLLQRPLFWSALGHTVYFVAVGVPLSMGASLGAAMLLNSPLARMKPFFRTALFAPVVTTVVAMAVIWRYLFNTKYGMANYALGYLGVHPIDWLGNPHWAMPTIILFAVWKNFGYNMIIFLAGLQAIPIDLYEVSPHHPADARADPADGEHSHRVGLFPAVRRTVRDDRRRATAEHHQRALLDVRRRLQVVEPGLRLGRGVSAVCNHVCGDRDDAPPVQA
jgi:ABC-type polysaccharide transport system permease subunit